jgi:hypothetical protein
VKADASTCYLTLEGRTEDITHKKGATIKIQKENVGDAKARKSFYEKS